MDDVTELLEKASQGDHQAQDELYRLTEPELRNLARHWIRRHFAGERVRTTEVIDRAFGKLMRIPSPHWQHRGAFYAFASRNLHCVLIDLLRHLPSQPAPLPGGDELDRVPARARGLTLHTLLTLREALEDLGRVLSETHRAIVELRFLWECTLDEAAERLSIGRDRAFRMSRVALAYLREKLGPSFPDLGHSPNGACGD
jgi:DNA-directed RNA polymerase specialized sigma24 family protein